MFLFYIGDGEGDDKLTLLLYNTWRKGKRDIMNIDLVGLS